MGDSFLTTIITSLVSATTVGAICTFLGKWLMNSATELIKAKFETELEKQLNEQKQNFALELEKTKNDFNKELEEHKARLDCDGKALQQLILSTENAKLFMTQKQYEHELNALRSISKLLYEIERICRESDGFSNMNNNYDMSIYHEKINEFEMEVKSNSIFISNQLYSMLLTIYTQIKKIEKKYTHEFFQLMIWAALTYDTDRTIFNIQELFNNIRYVINCYLSSVRLVDSRRVEQQIEWNKIITELNSNSK